MTGEPTPQRAQAAGLTLFLGLSGWLLAGGIMWGLDAAGVSPPKLNVGGGVAAAGAAVVILFLFFAVCAIALLAALGLAVWRERREPAAWRNAASSAALGVGLPGLLLFFDGPNANALMTVLVPPLLLFFAAKLDPKLPWLAALAVPALAVLVAILVSSAEGAADLARDHDDELVREVEHAADARDAGALQAALDALPSSGHDLDGVISVLPIRGDHLAEVEQILRHPRTEQTACAKLLRAALDGDVGQWRANAGGSSCRVAGAHFALRHGGAELVGAAAKAIDAPNERIEVLEQLVYAGDEDAGVRWIHAAGLVNDAGVIRPDVMTFDFVVAVYRHDERGFYWRHADVDGLLVAICGNDAYGYRVLEALDAGAHVNAHTPCGTTPLIATCTGHELNESTLSLLLDAGADPNLPGAGFCTEGAEPHETPLWHLVKRRGDWNNLPHHAIELLIDHGADTKRRGADGGSLQNEAADDHDLLEALKRVPSPP